MVAVFAGNGAGFERSSIAQLGASGLLGAGSHGRSGENASVNIANGNLILNRRDEFLVGRGPDASYGRFYNSLGALDHNGDNWRGSNNRQIIDIIGTLNAANSSVTRVSADGSEIVYAWDAGKSAYVTTEGAGVHDSITYDNASDTFTWTDGDTDIIEVYDGVQNYRIVSQVNKEGYSLSFNYDANGRLASVETSSAGLSEESVIEYTWSGDSLLSVKSTYKDNSGVVQSYTSTYYEYDLQNRLERVVVDLTPQDHDAASGNGDEIYETGYSYHGTSNLIHTLTQTDGSKLTFTYDGSDRILTMTQAVAVDQNGNVTESRLTTFAYFENDTSHNGDDYTTVTDALGNVTTLWYDAQNQLTHVQSASTGADPIDTMYTYDVDGNVKSVADGEGNVTRYAYDARGNNIQITNADGTVTFRHFDEYDNLIRETQGLSLGEVGTLSTNRSGVNWERVDFNRLIPNAVVVVSPITTNGTDPGNVRVRNVSESGFEFQIDEWDYLDGGHTTELVAWMAISAGEHVLADGRKVIAGRAGLRDDGAWSDISFGSDFSATPIVLGQVSTVNDAGAVVERMWNVSASGFRAQLQTEQAAGNIHAGETLSWIAIEAGGDSVTGDLAASVSGVDENDTYVDFGGEAGTEFGFLADFQTRNGGDVASLRIRTAANQSGVTLFAEEEQSADTEIAHAAEDVGYSVLPTGALASFAPDSVRTMRYVYNDTGTRLRYTISSEGLVTKYLYSTSANGNSYGQSGDLWKVYQYTDFKYPVGTDVPTLAEMDAWAMGVGDLSNNKITEYRYDDRGDVRQTVNWSSASGSGENVNGEGYTNTYYTYDGAGRILTKRTAGQVTESFVYDGMGRVLSVTDLKGGTTQTTFNDAANTTTIVSAGGFQSVSVYNRAGQLLSLATSGTGDTSGTKTYQYDVLGRLRIATDATGNETYYLYDDMGRLTAEIGEGRQIEEYRYDKNNKITARLNYANLITTGQHTALRNPDHTLTIDDLRPSLHWHDEYEWSAYDEVGRLVRSAQGDQAVQTYAYDTRGNLIETRRYLNKFSAGWESSLAEGASLADLPLPAKSEHDQVTRAFYDDDGREIGHLSAEGYLTEIEYNGAGEKISETVFSNPAASNLREAGSFDALLASVTPDAVNDRTYYWFYDGQGFLRYEIDAQNRVTEYVYNDGANLNSTIGNVRQTIRYAASLPGGSYARYDDVHAAVSALSGGSERASWAVYDNAHNRLSYAINAEGSVSYYEYDERGNILRITQYAVPHETLSLPTESEMNSWASSNAADARITQNIYSSGDQLIFRVNAEGYVTKFNYDAEGRTKEEAVYETPVLATGDWTLNGLQTALLTVSFKTSLYEYDSTGRLISTTDERGTSSTISYYGNGGEYFVRDAANSADQSSRLYHYDGAGRRTSTRYFVDPNGWSGRIDHEFDKYDGVGNRVQTTSRNYNYDVPLADRVILYGYDLDGNLTKITDPEGNITQYGYNGFGERIVTTDALGATSYTYYNELGQAWLSVDAEGYATENIFNEFGEVESTTRYATQFSGYGEATPPTLTANAKDAVTSYTYDDLGRVLTVTDAENNTTSFTYDAFGNVIRETDANGGVVLRSYDGLGQLVEEIRTRVNLLQNPDVDGNVALVNQLPDGWRKWSNDHDGNYRYGVNWPAGAIWHADVPEGTLVFNQTDNQQGHVYQLAGHFDVEAGASYTASAYLGAHRADGKVYMGWWGADGQFQSSPAATIEAGEKTGGNDLSGYKRVWVTSEAPEWAVRGEIIIQKEATESGSANSYLFAVRPQVEMVVNGLNGPSDWQAGDGDVELSATQFTYDANGNIKTQTDPNGAVTHYLYDGVGNLLEVTDAEGGVTAYVYDRRGNVIKTSRLQDSSAGRWVHSYTYYDKLDRVALTVNAEGYATEKIYDAAGNVERTRQYYTRFVDASGNLTPDENTPPDLSVETDYSETVYTYDRLGQVLTVKDAEEGVTQYAYDANGNVYKTTDANNGETYVWYDALGRVTLSVDAEGYATAFTYDALGNVLSKTRYYDALGAITSYDGANPPAPTVNIDGKDATTQFQYDSLGRVVEELLPIGSDLQVSGNRILNTFEYDALGNLIHKTEAFGFGDEQRDTEYVYDSLGRLVETWHEAVDIYDTALDGDASSGRLVEYVKYDATGNVLESGTKSFDETSATLSDPFARTLYYHDNLGRVTDEVSALGRWSHHEYDAMGNVVGTRVYSRMLAGDYANLTAERPLAAPTLFDLSANTALQDADRVTEFEYDGLGRLVETRIVNVVTAIGSDGASGYSVLNSGWSNHLVTQYQHDALGHVVKTIDPNGGETHAWFDKLGRKTHQIDAAGYLTKWTYDALGNVLIETRFATAISAALNVNTPPSDPAVSADDRETSYTYDLNGNRLSETRHDVEHYDGSGGTSIADATITYAYNANGQVTTRTEATGEIFHYEYDAGGRLYEERRPSYSDYNNVNVTPTIRYAYDGLGNLAETRELGTMPGEDRHTDNSFDAAGRLLTVTDAEGNVRTYRYDALGRVVREEYNRTLSDGTTRNEAVFYEYDAEGRIIRRGVMEYHGGSWNDATSSDAAMGVTDIGVQTLSYNAFGDIASRGTNGVTAETFYYDGAGRLWRSNTSDGTLKYFAYDANGNQTLMIASAGTDISDDNGDVISSIEDAINLWSGNVGTSYKAGITATITLYDAVGNAVEIQEPERELDDSATRHRLITSRAYNAFGEVISETNARGFTFSHDHNTMGRVISTTSPQVDVTSEAGVTTQQTPVTYTYYDLSGRAIASRDANGNLTRQDLLAGTGYGGTAALTTSTTYPDQADTHTEYDVFGNARVQENQLGHQTVYEFDQLGHVVKITYPDPDGAGTAQTSLIEEFAYDELGHQIKRWNNVLTGAGSVQTTDYDIMGRVTEETAFGGDTTTHSYQWNSAASSALGTFGGWLETKTYANSKTTSTLTDTLGHTLQTTDMGARTTDYTYDLAGRLVAKTGTGIDNETYSWLNTGQMETLSVGDLVSTFGYNKTGQLVSEHLVKTAQTIFENDEILKDQEVIYDALGRMTSWKEWNGLLTAGTSRAVTPEAEISYTYDANGNIRNSQAFFYYIGSDGNQLGSTRYEQDDWYRFDSMNRVVLSKGDLENGVIVRNDKGTEIGYNAAGQRAYAITTISKRVVVYYQHVIEAGNQPFDPIYDEILGDPIAHWGWENITNRDVYTYDEAGRLASVAVDQAEWTPGNDWGSGQLGYIPGSEGDLPATETTRAGYKYDTLGRVTHQYDFDETGTTYNFVNQTGGLGSNLIFEKSTNYLGNSNLIQSETSFTKRYETAGPPPDESTPPGMTPSRPTETVDTTTSYYYGAGTAYALGAALTTSSTTSIDNGAATTSSLTNTYDWYHGAVQSYTSYDPDTSSGGDLHTSDYTLNSFGQVVSVDIDDGRDRTVSFTLDTNGQVLDRDEADNQSGGDPRDIYYRFGGQEMGHTGNNGDPANAYGRSLDLRQEKPGTGAFWNGRDGGSLQSDFGGGISGLATSFAPGTAIGSYSVQASGESLSSVARQLWGDASLWYKLAEANGMGADTTLMAGQTLRVPAGVERNSYNAATFAPYDPSEAIGDLSPTAPNPKPEEGKQCGVAGQIILSVISIAVASLTQQYWLTAKFFEAGFGAVLSGGLSAAAGSAASQGVAMATGYQDQFSWNQVGLTALSAGVTTGLGQIDAFGDAVNTVSSGNVYVARGITAATSSAISQGLGVATGLQSKFSWSGVAAAGITANLQGNGPLMITARVLANAATRSALDGGSFEKNLRAAIPDVIGSAIGNAITRGISAQIAAAKEDTGKEAGGGVVERTLSYVEAVDMVLNPNEFALDNSETFALMEQAKFRVSELQSFDLETLEGDIAYLNDTRDAMATLTNYYRSSQQNWRDIQDRVDVALYGDAERRLEKVTVSLSPLERSLLIDQARMRRTEQNLQKGVLSAAANWSNNELAIGSMTMIPGAVYGTGKDLVVTGVSLADFGVRDLGGTALYNGINGLNTLTGLQVGNPFEQSWRDVQNAGQTAIAVGGAILNDPLGVVNEVRYASLLESEMAFRDGRFLDGWAARPERIIAELFVPGGAATKLSKGKTVAKVVEETADVGRVIARTDTAVIKKASGLNSVSEQLSVLLAKRACFVAGTPVLTETGTRPIEELKAGDRVWSLSEFDSGEYAWRRVLNTVSFEDKEIWSLSVSTSGGRGETILATGNHPFWVEFTEGDEETGGWTAVELLQPGDKLRLADGSPAYVTDVHDTGTRDTVHNFEVEGFHTYHVGTLGIWVHNTNCPKILTPGGLKTRNQITREATDNYVAQNGPFKLAEGQHLHHVSELVGKAFPWQRAKVKKLISIQHKVLEKYGIDWATDARNLVLAKNGNKVHSMKAKEDLARDLFKYRNDGLAAIEEVLRDHGRIAAAK